MLGMLYSAVCYLVFLASFIWSIAWVGNLGGVKTIDSGPEGALWPSLLVDAALLGLFALQHSAMARPAFKRRLERQLPAAVERSTYVLASSLALLLLLAAWRPLPAPVYSTAGPTALVLGAGYWVGWGVVLISTFMISHFDLLGLGQAWRAWRKSPPPPTRFLRRWLYRHVRHPIMLGFLIAFWCTPHMSFGHLLFALATTGYILFGTVLEERDLVAEHGQAYREYQREVPRLLPLPVRPPRHLTARPSTSG
jgi:protein-S-isoprenylcysteine O-methyltransferase Ste14